MADHEARQGGFLPIGAYGLIGDCRSAALVGVDGSIDWCCLPRFDSSSVFARILDADGGFWQIRPKGPYRSEQRYQDRTNLLTTVFSTPTGRVQVIDFMPIDDDTVSHHARPHRGPRVIRIVDCLAGRVTLEHHIVPMPNYGRDRITFHADGRRFHGDGAGLHYCVVSTTELSGPNSTLSLDSGESAAISLRCPHASGHCTTSENAWTVERARGYLRTTQDFWWRWIDQVKYKGPYTEPVWRSALALKLMTYAPSGAIVAAPTASLPEALGGRRNWDYRFTWLRDASFTLYAMFQLRLTDEAHEFFHWLARTGIGDGRKLQNLYRVDGDANTAEEILGHWSGYRGSSPVRIGNAAVDQLQLDVYGELLDSAYLFARNDGKISQELWRELHAVVDLALESWRVPDASIWESRGRELDYTYSKLMCWVAVDRGLRIAERFEFAHDGARWRRARREIRRRVSAEGYNRTLRSFTQTLNGSTLDAAMLRLSQVRFLSDRDPKLVSTVRALERHLGRGVLMSRYRTDQTDDGIDHGEEGAFLMCSFWLVDALAHIGEVEKAQRWFERLLSFSSQVGLLAEEVDARTGELLGNYPQAFTHLALIGAAVNIERARNRHLGVEGLRRGGGTAAESSRSRAMGPPGGSTRRSKPRRSPPSG